MSFPMRELWSRRSSGSPKPETEHENHHAQDTAGLTGEAPETTRMSKSQPFLTRIFSDTWTLEILCWLLALLSLVIILIVLGIFNGQPLQNWHSGLSLNTLISVVSQIAQTALFVPVAASISQMKWIWYSKIRPVGEMENFDKASRGPLDSLWLITKHPKWILVYLGALNTSLILLLGPFAQQSVSLPLRQMNSTANSGSVPISLQYQAFISQQTLCKSLKKPAILAVTNQADRVLSFLGFTATTDGSDGVVQSFEAPPPLVIAAITNGLLTKTPIDPSAVAADCETGNCTFPDYTSLAVCSSVEDVTPTIQARCPRGSSKTEAGCSYTVPPLQTAQTARFDNFTTSDKGAPNLWIGASKHGGYSNPATLTDFYMLFFPDLSVFSHDSQANVTASLVALKVSIFLCLKTYNTTVTNGRTLTKVADTQTPKFSEDLLTGGANPSTKITTADERGTEIYMETVTRNAFTEVLAIATFYGTYTGNNPDHPTLVHDSTSDAARAFGDIFYNEPPPDHITAIRPLLTNLETSMTNALRNSSNTPATAPGTATYNEIYISVDFRWLILPILSIALSMVFLVAVAVETRRKGVPVWKDGLGKVLCAVEPETRVRMEKLDDNKEGWESVPVVIEREGRRGWWLRGPREEWWTSRRGKVGA